MTIRPVLQDALVEMAKHKGKYENGIVSLQGMQSIKVISRELIHVDSSSGNALMLALFVSHSSFHTEGYTSEIRQDTIKSSSSYGLGYTCVTMVIVSVHTTDLRAIAYLCTY